MVTPKRIMLVDGSDATRKMVGQLLRKRIAGVEVISVSNAREALAQLKYEHYDLITTALALPDLDGLEFISRLRAISRYASTPVIVVSGDASARQQSQDGAGGATSYFDKSMGIKQLVSFIEDALPIQCSQKRVLYVEDSVTAAMVVRRILDRQNLDVVHTMTAEEALDHLRKVGATGPGSFDIVISDLFLKGRMSGTDLVRQIRHTLEYSPKTLPVLMITVEGGSKSDYAKLLASGANDYVTKPLLEQHFISRLKSLLALRTTGGLPPQIPQAASLHHL